MYHYKAEYPNIRELFLPDPGYTMCACDLDRADAQVVAWEAGDDGLKTIFRRGLDLHLANARDLFRLDFPLDALEDPAEAERLAKVYKPFRQKAKQGVHATNYGVGPRTLAATLSITIREAEDFINGWLMAHPAIREWHHSTEYRIRHGGILTNAFGYRHVFMSRYSTSLLQEALAWVPQSTVGLIIDYGWDNLERNVPEVQVLLQVHDELIFQVPTHRLTDLKPTIRQNLLIEVPYPDPLIIPVGLKTSTESWGKMSDAKWE